MLLSLATDALMVRKHCRLLEGTYLQAVGNVVATQTIKQQTGNRSDNCILGNNYLLAGHAFVTRNSNQTTRCSLRGGAWTAGYKVDRGEEESPIERTSFEA